MASNARKRRRKKSTTRMSVRELEMVIEARRDFRAEYSRQQWEDFFVDALWHIHRLREVLTTL